MATVYLHRASFVLLLAAVGCGSSKPGFEASDASSRGGEGGSSPSGGGGGGAGGTITVQQSEDLSSGMPTYNGLVSAFFLPDTASAADPSCTTTTAGSCQVQVCDASDAGPSSTMGSVSAGTIGVTGISPIPAMLIPDPDGNYEPFNTQSTAGPIILPNSTVQFDVSGAGGGVPSFKASVPIGGLLTITSPKVSGLTTQLPSGGDVPFAWTGGIASDRLQVFLSASLGSDSSKSVNVTCAFSGGSGSVPASAMAMMGNTGSMGAGPLATTSVSAGSYDVTIDVQAITVVALFSK